jgi:hypothetical protein
MESIQHKSNSHDSISIVSDKEKSLVIKKFYKNFERVKKNILKQRQFTEIIEDTLRISSVKVNDLLIKNSSIELSMNFIDGYNGADFILNGDRSLSQFIDKTLSFLLKHEISQSFTDNISSDIFQVKFNEIKNEIKINHFDDLFTCIQKKISNLPSLLEFPVGRCHGDLTLENIIYNSYDGIVLIDFIDTFLESPLQDVAKINQDLIFGWSARNTSASFQVKSTLFAVASYPAYASQLFTLYPEQIKILTLFSLIRILPYLRDANTEQWLNKNLRLFLDNYDSHITDFINMRNI